MSRTPVPFAPDTLESIRRAFRVASDRRHDLVSLEHMLHALDRGSAGARDPDALPRRPRRRCGRDLEEVLDRAFTPVPGKKAVKPESTLGFDRVVERAVVHAASSSAQQVESGALLVFLLQEEESHAAYFLRKQGVDRLTLLRAISHGGAGADGAGPRAGWRRRRRRPAADPLEAYADDLIARAAKGGIDPLIGRAARDRADGPGAVPPPQEQPAAGRRARRRQDRAGRRPGAAHSQGRRAGGAEERARVRARHGRARRRHALSRRLRGARQAGPRRARQAGRTRSCSSTRFTRSSAPARRRAGRWMPATC